MKKLIISVLILAVCVLLFILCFTKKSENISNQIILNDIYSREAYLNLKGWDVKEISHKTIIIPQSFEDIYNEYAVIQEKQKLPLSKYKGKKAELYQYDILNYNKDYPVYAQLIIYDARLVAAAIIEQKPDGAIKAL